MGAIWSGVYPAVTTQFRDDFSLDLEATSKVIDALIDDGVDGLVIAGTVGEGCSLSADEKRVLVKAAVEAAAGRVPVVVGIAEYTTALAAELAADAEALGADGLMVLPAMVYSAQFDEIVAHFAGVASASELEIMIYNNPPAYGNDITPQLAARLADIPNIRAMKESSGEVNRLVDLQNEVGERLIPFCGLDDVLLESVALGAVGWVSGMSNAFPKEGSTLFNLALAGRWDEARHLNAWFMPLLHLDARPDLVQCIKLCEHIAGRGSEVTRPPRLPLKGEARREVEAIMEQALANRPQLPQI
jgi:4-hydroxy-tetrahydrodipicolinate synthase